MFGSRVFHQFGRLMDRGVDRVDRMLERVELGGGEWNGERRELTEDAFTVLADAPYPATRNGIVSWAVNSGAEQEVVLAVLSLPVQDWASWRELREALAGRADSRDAAIHPPAALVRVSGPQRGVRPTR